MIALVIFGVTAATIALANIQAISSARLLEEQIEARWLTQNYLTQLRLENKLPVLGASEVELEFNNKSWVIDIEVNRVELELLAPYLRQVQLSARLADEANPADVLNAVLAKVIP